MRFYARAEVDKALDYEVLADALHEAFREAAVTTPVRQSYDVGADGMPGRLLTMPAWRAGEAIGVKLVNVFPENARQGLGAVSSLYALFDGATGAPRAVIEGDALTNRRTAAASALAARFLARADAKTLLVVGTGHLAPHLARAHAGARPISRILVHGRAPEKAAALADGLAAEGFDAKAVEDLPAAVREADIVTCATTSRAPLIHGADVKPSTHVDLVGAFTREMRESDDALIAAASVFVDTRAGALAEAGDLTQAMASGVFALERLKGDLFDLCAGSISGRTSAEEITVFKSVGAAIEDLVAAELLLARAP